MNNEEKILILNTGGTFNKYYEPISGELIVATNNNYIKEIFRNSFKTNKKPKIKGLLYKDSLELTSNDRQKLINKINSSKELKIIIIHGTDTMEITAKYISKRIKNKQIVLVGAMKPYSIDPIEAVSNLMIGYGFLKVNKKDGIFIGMHGLIKKFKEIEKNRKKGVFICQ